MERELGAARLRAVRRRCRLVTLGGLWTPVSATERKSKAKKTNGAGDERGGMAEQFERVEKQNFGDDGFEKMVDRVAQIERTIGTADLAQFTPARRPGTERD